MARVKIGLANAADENETITLEIEGSNDWVKETMTCVHGLFESIAEHSPFEVANADEAEDELREAFVRAEGGQSYAGKLVTTNITITDEGAGSATA